jgi:hypothetical protein
VGAQVRRPVEVTVRGAFQGISREAEPLAHLRCSFPRTFVSRCPVRVDPASRVALERAAQRESRGKHLFEPLAHERVACVEREAQDGHARRRVTGPRLLLVRTARPLRSGDHFHTKIMPNESDIRHRSRHATSGVDEEWP